MKIAPEYMPEHDPEEVPDHYTNRGEYSEDVSEYRRRQVELALSTPSDLTSDLPDDLLDDEKSEELVEGLNQIGEQVYGDKESVEEALSAMNLAASQLDSFMNSRFPVRAMG
jgi:hypothetical protein